MDVYFHDKILQQFILVYHARDVAAFNFKIHKSLEHLDLSTNEFKFHRKSIFTKEDMRKCIQPNRQVLYKHHLDLPTNLESFTCTNRTKIVPQNVFHLSDVCICDSVYGLGFETLIVEAIKSHEGNKTEKLMSYLKILRLLNFNQSSDSTFYFYEKLLPVLYIENCSDSELVIDFVNLFNFHWWIFNSENPSILKYVLHHAQMTRCSNRMWRLLQPERNTVNMCFLRHKITNFRILLMFGTHMIIPKVFNFGHYVNIPDWVFHKAVHLCIVSYRRAFLIFQLLYDFRCHQQSPEGLRCIWSSIKDPFLSHSELFYTLVPMLPFQVILRVHWYYSTYVSGRNCGFSPSPRNLKHLCRVEVRSLLNNYYQLPNGIAHLNVPETLKCYLYEF